MLTMPVELPEPQLKPHTDIVLRKRYLHKSLDGATVETPRDLFWRVAASVAESERAYPASPYAQEQLAREFYDLMTSWKFLPNSPTLMNAGRIWVSFRPASCCLWATPSRKSSMP